jgi:hypothetical protein
MMSSSTTSLSLEKFNQRDEYGTIFTVSLEIALYAQAPKSDLAEGPISCFERYRAKFRDGMKWYLAGTMRKPRKFSDKYAEVFPTLCTEPDKSFPLPFYRVFNGSGILDYRPPVFATLSDGKYSCLQMHLDPAMAANWNDLKALLADLAKAFPFRAGHVGYAVCWNDMSVDRDADASQLIGPLLKRHPGLSIGNPFELCDQPLPPVNWLKLIGPELLKKLGGPAKVERDLSDDAISVFAMGSGLCIRAGDAPQLGDVNRRDTLPLYRKVGAYLKPYRVAQEMELTGLDEEESEAWLARFDS